MYFNAFVPIFKNKLTLMYRSSMFLPGSYKKLYNYLNRLNHKAINGG